MTYQVKITRDFNIPRGIPRGKEGLTDSDLAQMQTIIDLSQALKKLEVKDNAVISILPKKAEELPF